mgnify:CR=1 FL=1
MAVIGGITVYELRESFQETASQQGINATIAYLVPTWADRYQVANTLLGLTTVTGANFVTHSRPLQYADSPNMWAQRVSIKGVGKCTQGPRQVQFEQAIVQCEFGIPDFHYDRTSDPNGRNSFDPANPYVYASQTLDFGTQIIQLKANTLKLSGDTFAYPEPYGIPVQVVNMGLTLHKLPYLPAAATRAVAGNVNNASFFGCAAGTLRFDGVKTQITMNSDGTRTQDAQYAFAYRPVAAWDKVLHPNGTSGWTQLQYNGASILTSIDFTTLIPTAYNA